MAFPGPLGGAHHRGTGPAGDSEGPRRLGSIPQPTGTPRLPPAVATVTAASSARQRGTLSTAAITMRLHS